MTKLKDNYFEIKRAGINTTFQDNGRKNLNHIGIPISGAMDKRNFMLANALLKNEFNTPVIEFAYQGPLLEFNGDRIYFVSTGDVKFEIIKNNNEKIIGSPYNVYAIEDKDQIDIDIKPLAKCTCNRWCTKCKSCPIIGNIILTP